MGTIIVYGHTCHGAERNSVLFNSFQKGLIEVSFLTGYGVANISEGYYEILVCNPRFEFSAKPLAKKINFRPVGVLNFVVEPFANVITQPNSNVEVGISLLLKYGHHFTSSLLGFIEGGTGMLYTSQNTLEQSTRFNFISQCGLGFQYSFTPGWALSGEYRFRHISNAGISEPNDGINLSLFLIGFSYLYH